MKSCLCKVSILLLSLVSVALAADEPVGLKLEAEAHRGSDSQIVDDADASGGKAVSNSKAWQPLVSIDTPDGLADSLTLHIRHKGGPLLLKGVIDGEQKEFAQVWDQPTKWKWSRVNATKAQLGQTLMIIRGDGGAEIGIDAVVFGEPSSADKPQAAGDLTLPESATVKSNATELPPQSPRADAAPLNVSLSIDWSKTIGEVPAAMWSVNDYEILNPRDAANVGFNQRLADLKSPIIRIHRGSFPSEWLDEQQKHFDVEKIKAAVGAASGYGDSAIMLNIATWPDWMNDGDSNRLAPEHEDAWVAMCVDLVKIMRDQVGRRVEYWEVTNERDGTYFKDENRLDDLWRIYNKAVKAMRAEDPSAKFGGPAFTWANPQWVEPFVKNCIANSDFVTYHNYGIGDIHDSNEKLYGTLDALGGHAAYIRRTVDAASPDRHIPIFLSEYNVKWTWDPFERRHANSVGTVFLAGVIRRAAEAGIDGAMHWHLKGNAYGLIDGDNTPRPPYHLYRWGGQWLTGRLAAHSVDQQNMLEVLPVVQSDGRRALLIANRADQAVNLPSVAQLIGEGDVNMQQINADGILDSMPTPPDTLTLPGYSVTLITR